MALWSGDGRDAVAVVDGESVQDLFPAMHSPGRVGAVLPPVVRHQIQDFQGNLLTGEVGAVGHGPPEPGVHALYGACNRYEIRGLFCSRWRRWLAIRCDRPGQGCWRNQLGQPNLHDELRARVSTWPPLRPARLRCERESVVVVPPGRFLNQNAMERS
jgi:hypothetical protein